MLETQSSTLVSVVIPTYNSEKTISRALESVLSQTYHDWEIVVVDDCSTDGTVDLVLKYTKQDSRITLIKNNKNEGPAVTRNAGIEQCRGRYIAFLDSDDVWYSTKLQVQLKMMIEKKAALSCTNYIRTTEIGKKCGVVNPPAEIRYADLLKQNTIGCSTAMYDTARIGKVYFPNVLKRQDLALWLKILKQIPYAISINESLVTYYVASRGSVSSNKFKAAWYQWIIYRDYLKLPLFESASYFCHYVIRGLRGRLLGALNSAWAVFKKDTDSA